MKYSFVHSEFSCVRSPHDLCARTQLRGNIDYDHVLEEPIFQAHQCLWKNVWCIGNYVFWNGLWLSVVHFV